MITKILASTAAISFALTATAFAQDKSATSPDTKYIDKSSMTSGEDRLTENVTIAGAGGEDRLTENVTAKKKTDGLGAIIAVGAVNGSGGEDRIEENLTLNIAAKDPKIGPIKGESQAKAPEGGIDILNWGLGMENGDKAPACVTEGGKPDADCNGIADESSTPEATKYERKPRERPQPRQQRR